MKNDTGIYSDESNALDRIVMEIMAPQLKNEIFTKIAVDFIPLNITHCSISPERPISIDDVIVLVCGFGSGWTGSMLLGADLVHIGHQIKTVSLPGYGNSDNMTDRMVREASNKQSFDYEYKALAQWAEKNLPGKRAHFVGHSLGAAVTVALAFHRPELVSSLTLLNPAGFEKRGRIELLCKFIVNGIAHGRDFKKSSQDATWKELKHYFPKQKSPFSFDRLKQRISEGIRISEQSKCILMLHGLDRKMPVMCIWGAKDFVYPRNDSSIAQTDTLNWNCFEKISLPLWHNTTMFGSELTAKAINNFICNIEI